MQVTLLGTGSAMPSPDRLQSGTLLEADDDALLVDCGSGVVHRLAQAGVDHRAVDAVLLTHHHLDHVADVPTLAKARVLDDHEDLTVVGPPGTGDVCADLLATDDLDERVDLTVTEVTTDDAPLDVGSHRVRAAEASHSKRCFAYRFGDAVALSGDTTPDEAVFDLVDGVDVLVHECSYPDGHDPDGHTTPTELGRGLAEIDVGRVVLTHLFPEAEAQASTMRETVADLADVEVTVGSDLDRFDTS